MDLTKPVPRRVLRAALGDPARRAGTLLALAAAADGRAKDLREATRFIADRGLRQQVEGQAADELHHAERLRERAGELAPEPGPVEDPGAGGPGLAASTCDRLGVLAFVAGLQVANQRILDQGAALLAGLDGDRRTRDVLESALADARQHLGVSAAWLDRCRDLGQGHAVRLALKEARQSRFLAGWRRAGLRSGAGFSRFVLRVLYWTVLVPFGLLARRSRRGAALQPARHTGIRSQY